MSNQSLLGHKFEIESLLLGKIRQLTKEEKNKYAQYGYKYVVLSKFEAKLSIIDLKSPIIQNTLQITVPAGFLSDGSSGGPDYGSSWIFHDYLYATHCFDDDTPCTREMADAIMTCILQRYDRMGIYCWLFTNLAWMNIFYLFSKAWDESGKRGAQFISDK